MKSISSKIIIVSLLIFFGLMNPIIALNESLEHDQIENVDFDDSLIIDICDGDSLDIIYPVMSDPIMVSDIDYDLSSIDIEVVDTPLEFCWNDYNNEDYTTSAKNQGWCGSCWAFCALGAIESLINIKEDINIDIDLSEQYLLSCIPASGSCNGGNTPSPFSFIMNSTEEGNNCNGIIFEECLPYMADDDIPCSDKTSDWMDYLVPLSGYGEAWLGPSNPDTVSLIKSKVYDNGPVYTLMLVDDLFRNFGAISHKSTSYFPYRSFNDLILNHAVLIVGWKDDPSLRNGGYWICKNSWDTDWGYDGFFNIEYGSQLIGYYMAWAEYDPDSFNLPPIADCGGFFQANVGEEIIFDGSNSIDAEGDIISYNWDFGDGTIIEGVNPTHIYSEPGYYEVLLTVSDNENKTSIDRTLVVIDEEIIDITFQGGNGLTLVINNPSGFDLFDCFLSIEISGGFQNMDHRNECIEFLSSNSRYTITLPLVGFGKGIIRIFFEDLEISNEYFMLGPFIFIR